MTSAGELINGSLRLLGVLAEGETPSATMSADALFAMNQMIDGWSTERLSVYATQEESFTWNAGEAMRSIGPTGDFVTVRPIGIDPATWYAPSGGNVSCMMRLVSEMEYNSITVKAVSGSYPAVMWVNNAFPDMEMRVWPVPSQDLTIHIVSVVPLSAPASLVTQLAFPPGYLRAFRYNLAVEIAPEYGVPAPKEVVLGALASKRDLKRVNQSNDVMGMPGALVRRGTSLTGWGGIFA